MPEVLSPDENGTYQLPLTDEERRRALDIHKDLSSAQQMLVAALSSDRRDLALGRIELSEDILSSVLLKMRRLRARER